MPPKKQIPAPIDRPISRAYLRAFTGWSTAYPPGMSDPTSCRLLENMMVNRDGSLRVRPGLRYMSFIRNPDDSLKPFDMAVVGTHEPFFLANGTKAYLFACRAREADGSPDENAEVEFRVLARVDQKRSVYKLTDPEIGFTVEDPDTLNFTSATTYVKYLQIDNKIIAMSNMGESFRLFFVGDVKLAKSLHAISRPTWSVDDKLTVVHPTKAWVDGQQPTYIRHNRAKSPAMDGVAAWDPRKDTNFKQTQDQHQTGGWAVKVSSLPTRTNLMPNPLDAAAPGAIVLTGWGAGVGCARIVRDIPQLRAVLEAGSGGRRGQVFGPDCTVDPGLSYQVALDWGGGTNITEGGCLVKWFTTAGAQIGDTVTRTFVNAGVVGRKTFNNLESPKGASMMRVWVWGTAGNKNDAEFLFNNVLVSLDDEESTIFSGGSGTNYFWLGTANESKSVFHPPHDVSVSTEIDSLTPRDYIASAYFRADTTVRSCQLRIHWKNKDEETTLITGSVIDTNTGWTRGSVTGTAPDPTTSARLELRILGVARGEWHYIDSVLFETGSVLDTWFAGSTPDPEDGSVENLWEGKEHNSVSIQRVMPPPLGVPNEAAHTNNDPGTLISSNATDNQYSFGFFYTFSNEIGESVASQITVVKTKRGWNFWKWETPNAAMEPSGTPTGNQNKCADQLVAYMPEEVFLAATADGAVKWSLYMLSWSDQVPVPTTAILVDERQIDKETHPYNSNCWLRVTPRTVDTGQPPVPLPTRQQVNYSDPGTPAQGLVCSDRLVVVGDRLNPARIRWSSNRQGSYLDFSANMGGGYKTLTSGNLYIAACVKLWQNPQSVDTITVLCMGTDGYSTGYYMAPATVSSSSEQLQIMGFEETTATPGTVSPFGCEVLNNALYHPLDEMIMKSTANNYNIAHKTITEQVQPTWQGLTTKQRVVSCQHDNRLYYLVNNPDGPPIPEGCMGNEVWVNDTSGGSDKGTWSRWLTPGCSLRKIEQGNRVFMSLVHPDGIFYFDDYYPVDDYVEAGVLASRNIAWKMETNTQGANKAHDAWAHLQQANLTLGNFQGSMRYGIRGMDVNGKIVDVSKVVSYHGSVVEDVEDRTDFDDYLQIRRDMKEWVFYAGSYYEPDSFAPAPCFGQLSLVQYRYTPVSVNVGYEYGSVETFEYGRFFHSDGSDPLTYDTYSTNGVPRPYIDTRRP